MDAIDRSNYTPKDVEFLLESFKRLIAATGTENECWTKVADNFGIKQPEPRKFVNGFGSWLTTYHEICEQICLKQMNGRIELDGQDGKRTYCEQLTDEFEERYKGVEYWSDQPMDYFSAVDKFVAEKVAELKNN